MGVSVVGGSRGIGTRGLEAMNDSLIRDKGKDTKPWVGGGGLLNTPKRESDIDIPMLDFR